MFPNKLPDEKAIASFLTQKNYSKDKKQQKGETYEVEQEINIGYKTKVNKKEDTQTKTIKIETVVTGIGILGLLKSIEDQKINGYEIIPERLDDLINKLKKFEKENSPEGSKASSKDSISPSSQSDAIDNENSKLSPIRTALVLAKDLRDKIAENKKSTIVPKKS